MENNKGIICVQGGWKSSKDESRVIPTHMAERLTFLALL
jgi:hypothetical protein